MALFNGLPEQYDALIRAVDAFGTDESAIHFEFVEACVIQEEQCITLRSEASLVESEALVLLFSHRDHGEKHTSFNPRPRCGHC